MNAFTAPQAGAVAGVELAAATAGLKASGRPDAALIGLAPGSMTAALFTRNAFRAAPVEVAQAHLAAKPPRLLLINSGCANAGTGAAGVADAERSCADAAAVAGVDAVEVLPFSTGVIGPRLDVAKLHDAVAQAWLQRGSENWWGAAEAILTTDTGPKLATRTVELAGGPVTITGMSKGSGMIRPDMATMLAFAATDAAIDAETLDTLLRAAVADSFHCITVDGDTSTNDAVTLSATGASGVGFADEADRTRFAAALNALFGDLAVAIVSDAEGVTRVIWIAVTGGRDSAECREAAFTVAHSPLVKTAVFGGDPNWGRILAAVGRAPITDLDVAGVGITLGDIALVEQGQPVAFAEDRAAAAMAEDPVTIGIDLGRGPAHARIWTSDLSHGYVSINADYRT